MLRFNQDKISKLISEIRKSVNRLKGIRELSEEEFLKNQDKIDSAKYNFIVAIESAIDICNHIISQNGFRAPQDYGDTFKVLAEEGAFEEEFVETLRTMAKFRNRLVHLYWEVDNKQVYFILQNHLDDFKGFLDKITNFIGLEEI